MSVALKEDRNSETTIRCLGDRIVDLKFEYLTQKIQQNSKSSKSSEKTFKGTQRSCLMKKRVTKNLARLSF